MRKTSDVSANVGECKRGGFAVRLRPEGVAGAKVRATLYVPTELLEEARDAVVFLAGYPVRLTLTRLVEEAFRAELRRLKELHNKGQDFPQRSEDLRGGRPIAA